MLPQRAQVLPSTNAGLSPERYAQKVVNYSKLDAHAEYFSGIHYSRLGNFLISPYKSYGDEWAIPIPEDDFQPVTICDLSKTRDDPARTTCLSQPAELPQILSNDVQRSAEEPNHAGGDSATLDQQGTPAPMRRSKNTSQTSSQSHLRSQYSGRVVFVRGFPSASWLNQLGATLDVDPEFLYRHLDQSISLTPNVPRLDYSYSTPFPESRDLIQLRVCNTGSWNINGSSPALAALREGCEDSLRNHIEDFARLRGFSVGDSIVRRFILHDLHNFSIEQKISIEVIHHTQTWSVVVWIDSGRDLNHCKTGPWVQLPMTKSTRLHPIFQHRSRMALSTVSEAYPFLSPSTQNMEQAYQQSINHIHGKYGRYLKTEIMAHDAFYALNELFEFSAASIDQLLELFEDNIRIEIFHPDALRLSELRILKSYIDDYKSYTKDISDKVHARGNPKWPRVTEPRQREKADRAAVQLENRYQRLFERCDRLSEHCASSISILMSLEAYQQSEKAMTQADRIGKLSVLAYIYIPISFAASFFGMNFEELGNQLSIWAFFVMSVPLLFVSILAWFIDVRATCASCWRLIKRCFCRRQGDREKRGN